jgi:hypothetical protein
MMTRTSAAIRWDRVSFGLAIVAWVATAVLFHSSWSFPFTPIAVAIPVGGAALPLLVRSPRARQATRAVAAALLFGFAWLAMFSVGILFLPATIAMLVGAVSGASRQPRSAPNP